VNAPNNPPRPEWAAHGRMPIRSGPSGLRGIPGTGDLGLRSRCSLQPRLSQDGPSALAALKHGRNSLGVKCPSPHRMGRGTKGVVHRSRLSKLAASRLLNENTSLMRGQSARIWRGPREGLRAAAPVPARAEDLWKESVSSDLGSEETAVDRRLLFDGGLFGGHGLLLLLVGAGHFGLFL